MLSSPQGCSMVFPVPNARFIISPTYQTVLVVTVGSVESPDLQFCHTVFRLWIAGLLRLARHQRPKIQVAD